MEHARDEKKASQAEQQHNINSAGTLLLIAEKSKGLVTAVLTSADRINDALRSTKELLFFLLPTPKPSLEVCKAWIRACDNPMIRS